MPRALAAPSPLREGEVTLQPVQQGAAHLLVAGSLDPEVTRWTQIPAGLTLADAVLVTAGWSLPSQRIARYQVSLGGQSHAGMVTVWLDRRDVAEVGYWLLAPARGRGVATIAVGLVCRWAFDECGLDLLQLTTLPGNGASENVARRCGFVERDWVERDIKGERRRLRRWSRRSVAAEPIRSAEVEDQRRSMAT